MFRPYPVDLFTTVITLALGATGFLLAQAANLPAAMLTGPAAIVCVAALSGAHVRVANPVRYICFVVLGTGVGAGFDPTAGSSALRWPVAFLMLAVCIAAIMLATTLILSRSFGFSRRGAMLAGAPGHLTFVLTVVSEFPDEAGRIMIAQSIRLLALTLTVPFIARTMGYNMSEFSFGSGPELGLQQLVALLCAGGALGMLLLRLGLPAPLFLGPMAVSATAHIGGLVVGAIPEILQTSALIGLGALIGTRFAGVGLAALRGALLAGLASTLISTVVATATAVPVAIWLEIPLPHVVTGFAPGGLETMIALGAVMGAVSGFVAACHMMRLAILGVMIPVALRILANPRFS